MKKLISLGTLTFVLFAIPAWAGTDTVGMEMHADSPVIVFADKYVGPNSMIHLWAVPSGQTNVLFRQNLLRYDFLPKFELGAGPGFSMVNDHQSWTHTSIELDHKMKIGKLAWIGYQLAQLKQHDDFADNGLLREQFFYNASSLGIVGENQFAYGQKPKFFWGLAYNFGQTSFFGTNKFFLTINLANTDEVWAAWILEI